MVSIHESGSIQIAQTRLYTSSDQGAFSLWDQPLKLASPRIKGDTTPIHYLFHLDDVLGEKPRGKEGLYVTNGFYQVQDGNIVLPGWFISLDIKPPLRLPIIHPNTIGEYLGEGFYTFAETAVASFAHLSQTERTQYEKMLTEQGYPFTIPDTVNSLYQQVTQGNTWGIVDNQGRSASSYSFDDTRNSQKKLFVILYGLTARFVPQSERGEVRKRLEKLVSETSSFYLAIKEKNLPQAAIDLFSLLNEEVKKITGASLDHVQVGESTSFFRLSKPGEEELVDDNEKFRFADWYLAPGNRDLYDGVFNTVAARLRIEGKDHIDPMEIQYGETPLWVIIDGKKYKLRLFEERLELLARSDKKREKLISIPTNHPLTNHRELAESLYLRYPEASISLIPTAIGYLYQLRATGDFLLPETGSVYTAQANEVWHTMQKSASPGQLDLIAQHDIVRVHPHAMDMIPNGHLLKLPWYLREGFPQDENGFTNTTDIKDLWKRLVIPQRRETLERVRQTKTNLIEKAEILFENEMHPLIKSIIENLKISHTLEQNLRNLMREMSEILGKEQKKELGKISNYIRGNIPSLDDAIFSSINSREHVEALKQEYQDAYETIHRQQQFEGLLKYFIVIRIRNLIGGISALEAFDTRPSVLSLYLLFGEEVIQNLANTTDVYVEKTDEFP